MKSFSHKLLACVWILIVLTVSIIGCSQEENKHNELVYSIPTEEISIDTLRNLSFSGHKVVSELDSYHEAQLFLFQDSINARFTDGIYYILREDNQ